MRRNEREMAEEEDEKEKEERIERNGKGMA